ncbi:MAG: DUF2935 domain-containing protein [Planctomycetes bacterium]|nr:DUF2935 domain-containing protein [Planctomycetota bacterium]
MQLPGRYALVSPGGAVVASDVLAGLPPSPASIPSDEPHGSETKSTGCHLSGGPDPVWLSFRDSLFWMRTLAEHAEFLALVLPAGPGRCDAERFQALFARHARQLSDGDLQPSTYAGFNRTTIRLVRPFIDFKKELPAIHPYADTNASIRAQFLHHMANDAERFVRRLEMYAQGETAFEQDEVVDFWTGLLTPCLDVVDDFPDPQEARLLRVAMRSSIRPWGTPEPRGALWIGPGLSRRRLADHLCREAAKFSDELRHAN